MAVSKWWRPFRLSITSQGRKKAKARRHPSHEAAKPTTEEYVVAGATELVNILHALANNIPVPFLAEFVGVAAKLVEVCQDTVAIEKNVGKLQKRVHSLSVVIIVDEVGGRDSEDLQEKIKGLQSTLQSICDDLEEIRQQRTWLLIFFRNLNKGKVEDCVGRLEEAMERFDVKHKIQLEKRAAEILAIHKEMLAKQDAANRQLGRIELGIEGLIANANKPHNAPPTLTRYEMPVRQPIFYGREDCVNRVASLLADSSTSRVCISGPGGMGKTHVALAVLESATIKDIFSEEYRFWIPCVKANTADALRTLLYAQLRITADSYDTLGPLMKELEVSTERRLLLLDNFETPYYSGDCEDREEVDSILAKLAGLPHVALLVTMTSDFPPGETRIAWQCERLQSLDAASARATYKSIYTDTSDGPELRQLLNAIGGIPLAITLMATAGRHSQASPKDLLAEWEVSGTDVISGGVDRSMNRTIGMSMGRGIVKCNPDAMKLVAILSLLPAGTTRKNLSWWAPSLTRLSAAIDILRSAALVEQRTPELPMSILPTIKTYVSRQNLVSDKLQAEVFHSCYNFILEHKSTPDDKTYKEDIAALASEETNIQAILIQTSTDQGLNPKALDALIAFSLYQFRTKPSCVVAWYALEVSQTQALLDGNQRHVAEARQCLGKILFRLDRYGEAEFHLREALRLFRDMEGGQNRFRAGECGMILSETLMYMGHRSDEVFQLLSRAKEDLCHDESQKYYLSRGLRGLGHWHLFTGDPDKALEMLAEAKAKLEEGGNKSNVTAEVAQYPASMSKCLWLMATAYAFKNDYRTARDLARDALEKADQAGDAHHTAEVLNFIARCLVVLSLEERDEALYDEALEIIGRALQMSRAQAGPLAIGRNLELLGYVCAAKMDLPGAKQAYDGAKEQFAKVETTGASHAARCTKNLEKLDSLGNLDQSAFSELENPE
ncbi:hypothetical protein DFH06DRAFT_1037910 [Mycena polygramma]|nr:hypothetical protein DFH06DRAFT_1037910 [Mycena polygramma]